MKRILFVAIALAMAQPPAWAKRTPTPNVEPVIHDGVKYVAPNDNGRRGYIEAWDVKTGTKLWEQTIFENRINRLLEEDVQWIFIKSLEVWDGKVMIADERNRSYSLDPKTRTVAKLAAVSSLVSAKSLPVYFGTYTGPSGSSKGIYRSLLDLKTGKLSEPVLAVEARNPSFLEIHPNGKFLYAVSESGGAGSVSAFAIAAETGDLKFLNQQPSRGEGPCHVNIDRTGKYALVANYGSGSAAVIPIQADGSLGEPTGFVQHEGSGPNSQRQKGPHAHSINISPDNRFVFVADLGIDKIMIYKLDTDKGALVANDPPFAKVKPGAGPRHFVFHPSGVVAYIINELDCTITAFFYSSASGALTELQTISTLPAGFSGSNACAEVRVHPNGKFLYGSNRGHNSIAVYRIDPAKGTLTLVEHETADIKTPRNFNIDPTGGFCLVANQDGDSVVVFRINETTGALEPTGQKVSVGKPVCIRFLRLSGM